MIEQVRRRILGPAARSSERAGVTAGYPDFRRNYALGIINGVVFNTGMSFFNRTTIVPVFMAMLGAPSILIALTSLFEIIGWHLPQFFASRFVVHKSLKMPLYRNSAIIRISGLLLAIVAAWAAGHRSHGLAIALFTVGFGLYSLAGGFAGLVFTEILAKTTPKEKRGSYFGWRAILSGMVGLYIGVGIIGPIFEGFTFSDNYLVTFIVGTILIALAFFLFTLQREPEQHDLPAERTMKMQMSNARRILRENIEFRRFIIFRALVMLWFASLPFYMLFAKDRLGATESEIGLFISWEFAGLIVTNLLWGFLSNRLGNRLLLIVACLLACVVSGASLLFDAGFFPSWSFGAIFFMSAAVDSGAGSGGINYALEIVPEGERPTYVGLMNSILAGALAVAAIGGGYLRDLAGYRGLFILTGLIGLAALIMILTLPEPRRRATVVTSP